MKKQSPFYKTGIAKSPLNTHVPGHKERYGTRDRVKDKAKRDKNNQQ
tara:strand:+ start:275 stop:415 length:141 start_codon:yes stop_codon:yes gene_type:complete